MSNNTSEYGRDVTIFDIETRPEPALVRDNTKPFDRSSVKVGDILRGEITPEKQKKADAKIDAAERDYWAKANDKAALSPATGSICAIGIHHQGEHDAIILQGDEKEIIELFWHHFRKNEDNNWAFFTGSNDKSMFDIMFIVRRSWMLGVPVPMGVVSHKGYFNNCFIDLAQPFLAGAPYPSYISADTVCLQLNLVGEDVGFEVVRSKESIEEEYGIEGKNFWEFIDSGKVKDAKAARTYLLNDLALERAICDRIMS